MSVHIQTTGRTAANAPRRPYETAATPDMTAARTFGAMILALAAYVLSIAKGNAAEDAGASRPDPQPPEGTIDAGPDLSGIAGLTLAEITSPEVGDVVNSLATPARLYDGEAVDTRPLIAAQTFALPPLADQLREAQFTEADLAPDVDFL